MNVEPPQRYVFHGKPILRLNPTDSRAFSFGVQKAKLILAHLDEIRRFVAENDEGENQAKAS